MLSFGFASLLFCRLFGCSHPNKRGTTWQHQGHWLCWARKRKRHGRHTWGVWGEMSTARAQSPVGTCYSLRWIMHSSMGTDPQLVGPLTEPSCIGSQRCGHDLFLPTAWWNLLTPGVETAVASFTTSGICSSFGSSQPDCFPRSGIASCNHG